MRLKAKRHADREESMNRKARDTQVYREEKMRLKGRSKQVGKG